MISPTLTVVIPAHREGQTIRQAIVGILATLREIETEAELVVVLDGPDDEALSEVMAIGAKNISVTTLPLNMGKGAAIREGCKRLDSEFTAFLDADLDLDPISLANCFNVLKSSSDPKIVCAYGSKFNEESRVDYPIVRRIGSRAFRWTIQLLFGFDCHDTQTGVKVFRTRPLIDALNLTRERRFIFDVELFWILSKMGGKFVDAPVVLNYRYSSTINLLTILHMSFDIFRLRMSLVRSLRLAKAGDFRGLYDHS